MQKKRVRLISLMVIACVISSMVIQTVSAVTWYDSGFLPMGHKYLFILVGTSTTVTKASGVFAATIWAFPPTKWYCYLEWQRYESGVWKTKIEQVVTVIWVPAPLLYMGTWYSQAQLWSGTWRCRVTWLSDGIWHSCRQDSWSFTIS